MEPYFPAYPYIWSLPSSWAMNAPGIPPRLSRVSWNLSGGPPP